MDEEERELETTISPSFLRPRRSVEFGFNLLEGQDESLFQEELIGLHMFIALTAVGKTTMFKVLREHTGSSEIKVDEPKLSKDDVVYHWDEVFDLLKNEHRKSFTIDSLRLMIFEAGGGTMPKSFRTNAMRYIMAFPCTLR